MKIVILWGTYFSLNRGVNALTYGVVDLIKKEKPDSEIIFIGSGLDEEKKIDENIYFYPIMRYVGKKGFFDKKAQIEFKNLIIGADYILDISEGDSFADIYGFKRLIQYSYTKYISGKNNQNAYMLPQTFGPFRTKLSNYIAKKSVENLKKVYTRDYISYEYSYQMKGSATGVFPDMAFAMEPVKPKNTPKILEKNEEVVGINISGLLWQGGYTGKNEFGLKVDYRKFIIDLMKCLLENNNILLVPHTYSKNMQMNENDLKASLEALNELIKINPKYKDKIEIVEEELIAPELKWIISKTDFFVGARMHACIAATSTNVPTAAISYSRKFIGLYSSIGLDSCVFDPAKEERNDVFLSKVLEHFENRKNIRELVTLNMKYAKIKLENLAKEIFKGE